MHNRNIVIIIICLLLIHSERVWGIKANVVTSTVYRNTPKNSSTLQANILINWKIQNNSLHFVKNKKGLYESKINCIIRISNDTTIFYDELFTTVTPTYKDSNLCYITPIIDQYLYPIPITGAVTIELVLFEQNYKKELFEFKKDVVINAHNSKNDIYLSDIRLLDTSFNTKEQNIFTNNGVFDLPKINNFINENESKLDYLFEVYNNTKKQKNTMYVKQFLSYKPYDSHVPNAIKIDTLKSDIKQIQFFRNRFETSHLKSGNYYLNVVINDSSQQLDKKCIFIQVYNPKFKDNNLAQTTDTSKIINEDTTQNSNDGYSQMLDLTNTFVGKYNASQVRAILKMLLLICNDVEGANINSFLKKPDELYSKYFIYNFWEQRNKKDPKQAWLNYAEKIKEVNKLFRGSGINGYETDRGRIYIQYGKPNDRIIVNNESGSLPYEIWQYYNIEKIGRDGVFLFYKPGKSLGDYQLLHSTVTGEVRNPNWRSSLYSNSITNVGISNPNTQAEQYIGNK